MENEDYDLEIEEKIKQKELKIKRTALLISVIGVLAFISVVYFAGSKGRVKNDAASVSAAENKMETKDKLAGKEKPQAKKETAKVSDNSPVNITKPIMFNTFEADAIMKKIQLFPKDNPWNEDISGRPVHPNSANMMESCDNTRKLAYNLDMGFVLVPPDQKKIDVKITSYPDESDKGPYPLPDNAPIEGYPIENSNLDDIQRNGKGDRHSLVLDPVNMMLYEFYILRKTDAGWECACEATFDLKTNKTRPKGWTSSDAAGLPVMPAAVRYDDVESGIVAHAMRVTFKQSRAAYVWPATHYASKLTGSNLPRMGDRVRLKAGVDISNYSAHPKAILAGLKKYGAFMADNGGNWRISVCPDSRIKNLDELGQVHGSDFEVIVPTGKNEGPRAK